MILCFLIERNILNFVLKEHYYWKDNIGMEINLRKFRYNCRNVEEK